MVADGGNLVFFYVHVLVFSFVGRENNVNWMRLFSLLFTLLKCVPWLSELYLVATG